MAGSDQAIVRRFVTTTGINFPNDIRVESGEIVPEDVIVADWLLEQGLVVLEAPEAEERKEDTLEQ